MLITLEEAILNNYDYCVDSGPSYCYDEILTELVKAGMLPPSLNGTLKYSSHNEWEPEESQFVRETKKIIKDKIQDMADKFEAGKDD